MNTYYGFLAGAMFLSGVAVLTHYATAATEPDLYKTATLTIISFGGAMLFLMMGAEL